MTLTNEILLEIEEMAGLFMTPKAISIIVGIEESDFMDELEDEDSAIYKHYYRGHYKSEAELRTAVMRLAKQGSSPAQTLALKLWEQSKTAD
ncbi:hypothetical protein [Runella sp.]|uniref:hypothetical protein n=1 Tax=Runella sp. TaxID=1960881 RepID=UPI003D11D7A0